MLIVWGSDVTVDAAKAIAKAAGLSERFIITDVTPSIIRMFKILLPTTLPTVIAAFPFNAAVMLTAASGADFYCVFFAQ